MQSETVLGSWIGVWLAIAADLALQLFGVPLQVVLAAAMGAFGARSFLPPIGFWPALGSSSLWTAAGAICAQLLLALANAFVSKEIPIAALAGVALVGAAGGQLFVPVIIPVIRDRLPGAVNAWFDRFGKGKE